ncbi:DUF2079 domain-containing protein [Streptantibioticus parmotrematis]|nr:DUF2079 domain-containing protein [Streptantibioticus parmotrematis]
MGDMRGGTPGGTTRGVPGHGPADAGGGPDGGALATLALAPRPPARSRSPRTRPARRDRPPVESATGPGLRLPGPVAMGWTLCALFFSLYAIVSVRRHERMLSAGYDLGIFEQAVRAYAHGHAPVADLKGPGFDLLGDHFHPVLALLAPLYRLFPGPLTLLLAQAALMALACLPLTRWAHRVAGPVAGLVIGCATGASWGIASAIGFDFHEIAFAVPLLAFSMEALGRSRWRAAVLWAAPLLLVKEDLGLTLAAVGLYVAWHGPRRLGLVTAVVGVIGTAVEVLVLLPAANPHGTFDYWHQMSAAHPASGTGGVVAAAVHAVTHLFRPPLKLLLLAMLAGMTACVGPRSPITALCLPTLAWRLLSADPHYWGVGYHYSAVLMPIVLAGLVDVLARRPELRAPATLRRILTVVGLFALVTTAVYPLHDVVLPSTWRTSAHVRTAHRLADRIPDGATVAASNRLAPLLTDRATVSLVCEGSGAPGTGRAALPARLPAWVVVDRTDPTTQSPCSTAETARMLTAYRADGYRTVADESGILLLRGPFRPGPPAAVQNAGGVVSTGGSRRPPVAGPARSAPRR